MSTVGAMDPADSLPLVEAATERLLADVRGLSDADTGTPSSLPNWSRGHVLTHLARNADGLANLLVSARTGERRPMYASQEQRNADIEAGAARPVPDLTTDLVDSHRRFTTEAGQLADWSATVFRTADAPGFPVEWVPLLRLGELEIHHTDLDVGYGFGRWPADWVAAFLPYACFDLTDRAGEPVDLRATDSDARLEVDGDASRTVEGPLCSLLAWVTGRHDGHDLRARPDGPLPSLGSWR